ncbi:MAG TPA: glutaredoxin [Xanthomonadales bacterium]|nr:glutaredoxin [Xanthomonadales bacterium]
MTERSSVPDLAQHDEAMLIHQARQFVAEVIGDPAQPVVIFALAYCEFCAAAQKFFAALELEHRKIDLGSEEFQSTGWGRKLRQVLRERTGSPTVPQIFIAGEHVGGASDFFDGYKTGSIPEQLSQAGLVFKHDPGLDPHRFLQHY